MRKFIVPALAVALAGGIAALAVPTGWKVWREVRAARAATILHLDCRFTAFCEGGTCSAPLPPRFRTVPGAPGKRPHLQMDGRPSNLSAARKEHVTRLENQGGDEGNVIIDIADDLSFSYFYQIDSRAEGYDSEGRGSCVEVTDGEGD